MHPLKTVLLYSFSELSNKVKTTSRAVRKDTIPTAKIKLEVKSTIESKLRQTVQNLTEEIGNLRAKLANVSLATANAKKHNYTDHGGAALALKLGGMEERQIPKVTLNARRRGTIPHMRKRIKLNNLALKQDAIEQGYKRDSFMQIRRMPLALGNISMPPDLLPTQASGIGMPNLYESRPTEAAKKMPVDATVPVHDIAAMESTGIYKFLLMLMPNLSFSAFSIIQQLLN